MVRVDKKEKVEPPLDNDWRKIPVHQLRVELSRRHLPCRGSKEDLVLRLQENENRKRSLQLSQQFTPGPMVPNFIFRLLDIFRILFLK